MTIAEARVLCKAKLARLPLGSLISAALLLAVLGGFLLGYLWGREAAPAQVEIEPVSIKGAPVLAARSGSKYYLPWCGGAGRISPKNLIAFPSAAAAAAEGYAPAADCK